MSQTDLFRKAKSLFSTTLSVGIGTGTGETITPASVSGLPTDTEVTLTFDRVDADGNSTPTKMERITGTISGGNLTSYTRGIDGSTEQAHSAGAVIEYIWNADDLNDIIDGLLVGHTQAGAHSASLPLTTPKITTSINDTNGNEVFKITATTDAVNELTVANGATTASPTMTASGETNVGFDLKMKGTGKFRKPTVVGIQVFDAATDTATGDGKAFLRIPAELNGMNLTGVAASVYTAGTTGNLDIVIRNHTDTQDMLSTAMRIETGETDTSTSAQPGTIDTAKDDVVTGDVIAVDVDAVQTTEAKGLYVELRFELPA